MHRDVISQDRSVANERQNEKLCIARQPSSIPDTLKYNYYIQIKFPKKEHFDDDYLKLSFY